ncbi:MAG: OmpA family protein [Balneolaceae bacterium]
MKSLNILSIVCLLFGVFIISTGCRSSEPVAEPVMEEQEPEPMQEVEDDYEEVEEEEPEPEIVESLNSVHFGFDLHTISDNAARLLAENVEQLREFTDTRVRIDAFTDHIGGDQYNLRLSVRRANAVREFYVNNGISEDRIDQRGLGKHPIPCTTAQMDTDTPGCVLNRIAESHPLAPDQFSN